MRINRSNDYLFKRIFGSDEGKDVLLSFLNAVLKSPPDRELTTVNLLDREQDPAYLLDRSARLDILASTEDGTIINIEVQITNEHNIAKRTMYYWAGLYHDQLPEGKTFIELYRTITINILSFNWFQDDQRYHRTFHVRDDETGELLNDDLEVHFMELRKIEGIKHSPQDAIEAWMMYLNNLEGEEMEAIAMDNPGIKKALTIEQAFMRNKQERRIYELREKAIKDELSALAGLRGEGQRVSQRRSASFLKSGSESLRETSSNESSGLTNWRPWAGSSTRSTLQVHWKRRQAVIGIVHTN